MLAVALVASALIVSRRTVNVNIQGPLTVCNTQDLNYGNNLSALLNSFVASIFSSYVLLTSMSISFLIKSRS